MTPTADKKWGCINELLTEISRSQDANAPMSAVAMTYICIDTLAFLALPSGRTAQTRADFIAWVDTYLKAESTQTYRYRGIDVYAARCGLLHAFTAEAKLHREDPDIIMFAYADNGPHLFNPAEAPRLAIISVAVLVHDLAKAVDSFLTACVSDGDLRGRVESRLPMVYANFPLPQP